MSIIVIHKRQFMIDPERMLSALPAGGLGIRPLDDQHVRSWREQGFAFVSGIFPSSLIRELSERATTQCPDPESTEAAAIADFGSDLNFPSQITPLNQLTLHPELLASVTQLLTTPVTELRLTQSDLWPKYSRAERTAGVLDNADQRIHVDYPNHTLAHPAECISVLHEGWAWSAYRRDKFLEKLIARTSGDQHAVLGFPQPGSPYWSEATIAAVQARHGCVFGMDMTPYTEALESSE
ncbi:MAG: hypothetical protein QF515_00255 [Pseudomonadales bacterium]|nr:hypothetical protein [Pseudomonadales bacterium]MDP6471272.1 hypothetical protein [Pseudomonadales bacterium]MDP6825539.1 hypothetical protein [Pseudomonadales bacterium]